MTYSVVSAGAGYIQNTYYSVPLFGGSGSGATATITVGTGFYVNDYTLAPVTGFVLVQSGVGYRIGDILDLTLATNPGLVQGSGFRYQVTSIGYTQDTRNWLSYESMPERAVDGMAVFGALDPDGVYQIYARLIGSLAARMQYDSRFLSRRASPVTAEAPQQLLATGPIYGYDVSTLKLIGEESGYSVNALDSVSRIRAGLLTSVSSTKIKGTSAGVADRLRTMGYKGYANEVWGTPGAARVILSPSSSPSDTTAALLQFPLYSSTPGIRVSNWAANYPVSYSGGVITYNNIAVIEVSGGRDPYNRPNGIPSTNDYCEVFDGTTHFRFVYMPYVTASPAVTLVGSYSGSSTSPVTGVSLAVSIMTLGIIVGGSSYTNGTYTNVPLTGGSGTGAIATVTVAGNTVVAVVITTGGANYVKGDSLSAAAANIGGTGSGFSVPVTATTSYGSGAVATVYLSGGSVTSVVITTPGSNYAVNDILVIPTIAGYTTGTAATVQLTAAFAYTTAASGVCEYAPTVSYGFLPGYNVNGYPSLTTAPAVGSAIYNDAASVYAYGLTNSGYLDVRGLSNPRITDISSNPYYLPAGVVGYAQGSGTSIAFTVGADGSLVTVNSLYNYRPYSVSCGQTIHLSIALPGSLFTSTTQYMAGATPVFGTFSSVPVTPSFSSVGHGALATVVFVGGYVKSIVITTLGYGYLPADIMYIPYTAIPGATSGPVGTASAHVTLVAKSGYYFTATVTSPSANPLIALPGNAGATSPKAVAVPVWIDQSANAIYQNAFNLYSTINSWNTANGTNSNYVLSAPINLTTVAEEAGYQPPTSTYGYQTINNRSILAPPLPALTKSVAPNGLLILNGGGGYTYTDPSTGYSYNTYRQYGAMNGGHGDGLYAYITVTSGAITGVVPDTVYPGYEYQSGDILVPGAGVSYDMLGSVLTDPTAITTGTGFSCIVRGQRSLETVPSMSITGGSGYSSLANGQAYELVSSNGSGALAIFTISGGAVTGVALTSSRGQNYQYGDVLTAPTLPGGTGFQCSVSTVVTGAGLGLISGLNENTSTAVAKTPSNGSSLWSYRGAAANYVEVPQSYDYNVPGVFLPMSQVVVHVNHADGSYVDFSNPDGTGTYSLVGGPGTDGNALWNRINRELVSDILPACISIKYFATDFNIGKNSNALNSASLNSVPEVFTTTESTDFHQATSGVDNVAYSYGQALGLWA